MSLSINLDITIRNYQETDLQTLQWAGAIQYRSIFVDTYERKQKNEVVMLVAVANDFPAGTLWLDLDLKSKDSVGILYALQVIWILRSMGIGRKLIETGLEILRSNNLNIAELSVKKDNLRAKKLYISMGFQVIREELSRWSYADTAGITQEIVEDVWVMQKNLTKNL